MSMACMVAGMSKLTVLFRMDINNRVKCFVMNGFFLTFAAIKIYINI